MKETKGESDADRLEDDVRNNRNIRKVGLIIRQYLSNNYILKRLYIIYSMFVPPWTRRSKRRGRSSGR